MQPEHRCCSSTRNFFSVSALNLPQCSWGTAAVLEGCLAHRHGHTQQVPQQGSHSQSSKANQSNLLSEGFRPWFPGQEGSFSLRTSPLCACCSLQLLWAIDTPQPRASHQPVQSHSQSWEKGFSLRTAVSNLCIHLLPVIQHARQT